MRVRLPFAGAYHAPILLPSHPTDFRSVGFGVILVASGYAGLRPGFTSPANDKVLHFLAFFFLTLTLYWALDIPRRLLLKLVFCSLTLFLSLAGEVLQGLLDNGRDFDPLDIVANSTGSALGLALCSWYHKRMLERKRRRKVQGYGIVPGVEGDDVELGEGGGSAAETGLGDEVDIAAEAWDEIEGADGAEGDISAQGIGKAPEPKD
jgi:hypothetical protein